jgi:uncharacterized integral membrane protein
MKTFLKAIILVPLALGLVLFAIANREIVKLSLDPIAPESPLLAFHLPLYAIVLAALILGVVIGGLAAWLVQGKHRKSERIYRKEASRLRDEAETLRASVPQAALANLPARRG